MGGPAAAGSECGQTPAQLDHRPGDWANGRKTAPLKRVVNARRQPCGPMHKSAVLAANLLKLKKRKPPPPRPPRPPPPPPARYAFSVERPLDDDRALLDRCKPLKQLVERNSPVLRDSLCRSIRVRLRGLAALQPAPLASGNTPPSSGIFLWSTPIRVFKNMLSPNAICGTRQAFRFVAAY